MKNPNAPPEGVFSHCELFETKTPVSNTTCTIHAALAAGRSGCTNEWQQSIEQADATVASKLRERGHSCRLNREMKTEN